MVQTRSTAMNSDTDELSPDGKILLAHMQSLIQSEFAKYKTEVTECLIANQQEITSLKEKLEAMETTNHQEITSLKQRVKDLETKLDKVNNDVDWGDQYERKDMVILSGRAVHDSNESDVNSLVKDLLKTHLNVDISPSDINTAHYLAPLRRNTAEGGPSNSPPKRNIIVKLVRRDIKKKIIQASREHRRNAAVFANESLTPVRRKIFHALRSMRKSDSSLVKGCTTLDGKIYAYTKPVGNSQRDQKHHVSTMNDLRDFCRQFVKKPLEDFLNNFSA